MRVIFFSRYLLRFLDGGQVGRIFLKTVEEQCGKKSRINEYR